MSGKILISIVLGVLVIGGGIWLLSPEDRNQPVQPSESATSEADSPETADTSNEADVERTATMRDLIARGEALECTFSFEDQDGVAGTGTGYFANDERMRMESTITQDGETYAANYIINDETMYMWGEMQQGDFGIQMSFSAATEEDMTQNESDMPVEMDENIDFSCTSWSVDESRFTVPTNIEFMDMDAMMQGAQGMTPEQMQSLQEQYAQ